MRIQNNPSVWSDKLEITDISVEQVDHILHGLEMIIGQYPCRASELRKDHKDRVKLAEIEAMYLVLGGKL